MAIKLSKEEIEAIEHLARRGESINRIAAQTGLSLSSVSKYVAVMRARLVAEGARPR